MNDDTKSREELLAELAEMRQRLDASEALVLEWTERKRHERAVQNLAAIVGATEDAIVGIGLDGTITNWNAGAERLFGYLPGEAQGMAAACLVPADRAAELAAMLKRIGRGERIPLLETILQDGDGRPVEAALSAGPIRDRLGRVVGAVLIARNIAQTRQLETQFRQAQKMEAIGRLAGGIAHDFNNLLTIISGYCELLLDMLPPADAAVPLVKEIHLAGERAAGLTRQLLLFSRKQVADPRLLDLNALVVENQKLLGRLLGEDIDLTTVLAPDTGPVRADASQLGQVLLNLAVNARDAMPQGGSLTIETQNIQIEEAYTRFHPLVQPGPYVLLAVTDTGCGMTEEVRARVFEPFFTTKGPNGTGLGLAVVHGVIKQSGGHVEVYSEPGRGTCFKIYLPRIGEALPDRQLPQVERLLPTGRDTILLVEDEPGVRAVGRQVLQSCGYAVLEASDPREALRLAEAEAGPIHLLLTDVVMPTMSGRRLWEILRSRSRHLKVLFVSGYTNDTVIRHGVLESKMAFLQKPFNPSSLARKVREVLDEESTDP